MKTSATSDNIDADSCMELVLSRLPEFAATLRALRAEWSPDAPGLFLEVSELARFVRLRLVEDGPSLTTENAFAVVEELFEVGDAHVKDAVATCFVENILNASSAGELDPNLFVPQLGPLSRQYGKDWNRFTGTTTPGL